MGMIIMVFGALLILLAIMDLPGISTKDMLLGGAVIGLLVIVALQPTQANIVAGVVVPLSHPFTVGERIRIRGSFGGDSCGTVVKISLLHVVPETDQGVLRLPDTGVSAAAVGPYPSEPEPPAPGLPG